MFKWTLYLWGSSNEGLFFTEIKETLKGHHSIAVCGADGWRGYLNEHKQILKRDWSASYSTAVYEDIQSNTNVHSAAAVTIPGHVSSCKCFRVRKDSEWIWDTFSRIQQSPLFQALSQAQTVRRLSEHHVNLSQSDNWASPQVWNQLVWKCIGLIQISRCFNGF